MSAAGLRPLKRPTVENPATATAAAAVPTSQTSSSSLSRDTSSPWVVYTKIDEQPVGASTSGFVKYEARSPSTGNPITMLEWLEGMAGADNSNTQTVLEFSNLIAKVPYRAIFFETPGVNAEVVKSLPFQFVLMDAPSLDRFATGRASKSAFAEIFDRECKDYQSVCAFDNLSGDARLVSPLPFFEVPSAAAVSGAVAEELAENQVAGGVSTQNQEQRQQMQSSAAMAPQQPQKQQPTHWNAYAHLASFVREAPTDQQYEFWKVAAEQMLARLQEFDTRPVWFSTCGTGVPWLHLRLDSRPKYYSYEPFRQVGTSSA